MSEFHTPVMLNEVLKFLNPKPQKTYVDCTLGAGGHAEAILEAGGRLIGIDQDEEVLSLAQDRLGKYGERATLVLSNFKDLRDILQRLKIEEVEGIVYDLGLSSYQLTKRERGFSFQLNGPLDMRMNIHGKIKAADLVNNLSRIELTEIIRRYGEERWASRIAKEIVVSREKRPIDTTFQLVEIIESATPKFRAKSGIHPATRTFQALRIVVNNELEVLDRSLQEAICYLRKGGRLIVISFHSLEDRIVKRKFLSWAKMESAWAKILTKKPIMPTRLEVTTNPKARSAKLRAVERL